MTELELIKKAQRGDQEAITQIFNKYKGLVINKSYNFFLKGGDREDLLQEAMIGLLKAVRVYDNSRNASFHTFASLCIKRQIITAIKFSNSRRNNILNKAINGYYESEGVNVSYFKKPFDFYNPEDIFLGKKMVEELRIYLFDNLSKMEKEIFESMVLGKSYLEIAKETGRNVKTIDNTIQRIKRKIKVFLKD